MTEKNDTKQLIDRLEATRNLSRDEWIRLIQNRTADDADYLFERAQAVRTRHYGCLLYTSPSPRDPKTSRMPSSA